MTLKETDGKKGNLGDADWDRDGVCKLGDEHKPWKILNKLQRVATSQRLARVGKSDSWRSSSWGDFHCCRITRAASKPLRGLSPIIVSFMLRGCQVAEAYSRIGRTRARYNVRRVLMGQNGRTCG